MKLSQKCENSYFPHQQKGVQQSQLHRLLDLLLQNASRHNAHNCRLTLQFLQD